MKVPAFEELSREQEGVYFLPLKGHHLIAGPPGTGKTSVAMHRAKYYENDGHRVRLLTFGNLLKQFMIAGDDSGDLVLEDTTFQTFHSWMHSFWRRQFPNVRLPTPPGDRYGFAWHEILPIVGNAKNLQDEAPNLIIDEGQDLPPEFYQFVQLISRNVTVFADENQRIIQTQTNLEKIKASLGLTKIHYLKKNYRNSLEIAKLARTFYTGLKTGTPELPDRTSPPPPSYIIYKTRAEMFKTITRFERNNTDLDIGVFLPYRRLVTNYANKLQDETQNRVQWYVSQDGQTAKLLNFDNPGIKVTTFNSAKGLEFDAVFIPAVNKIGQMWDPDKSATAMMFYVLISRARDRIEINQFGTGMSPLANLLQHRVKEANK